MGKEPPAGRVRNTREPPLHQASESVVGGRPRKRPWLLIAATLALTAWLAFLAWLASLP